MAHSSRPRLRILASVLALGLALSACEEDRPLAPLAPECPDSTYAARTIASRSAAMDLAVAADGTVYYVDYFAGTLGVLDPADGAKTELLTGLQGPHRAAAAGARVWFTESGTPDRGYLDGRVSVYDPGNGSVTVVGDGLRHPTSLCLADDGAVYVQEDGWGVTPRGIEGRLVRFRPGAASFEVVIPALAWCASAVALDRNGDIYLGTWGGTSPSDLGELHVYPEGAGTPTQLLTGLPVVEDLAWGPCGRLYFSGFGADDGPRTAIGVFDEDRAGYRVLQDGLQARGLGIDARGAIYFGTSRTSNSIRVLLPD